MEMINLSDTQLKTPYTYGDDIRCMQSVLFRIVFLLFIQLACSTNRIADLVIQNVKTRASYHFFNLGCETMNSDKNNRFQKRIPIPRLFYSELTGERLDHCIHCGKNLENAHYLIEKAVRKYNSFQVTDTVFEYAICVECQKILHQSFSAESLNNIQNYFQENVNFEDRRKYLQKKEKIRFKDWIAKCLVKATPIEDCQEFQLVCECVGNKMILGDMPYMISSAVSDEIMNLLSNATLDEMNRFRDRFLGPSPEIRELLKDRPFVLL